MLFKTNMNWITRERPKIDRLACPWLIKRFIDPEAEFIYVPLREMREKAAELNAIPFDIPGVEFSHYRDRCTFDYFLEKYQLSDPALRTIALIVRGADTDAHHLASQASGLWAISAGMALNFKNDYKLLEKATLIYDALYTWATHLQDVKHTQNPVDSRFLDIHNRFLEQKKSIKNREPGWVSELKIIIQEQVDINQNLSLKQVAEDVNIHPAYISREFSKHFGKLSFGDFVRKLRIQKAIKLIDANAHTLSEIAFLTGFSDQSHFTRIFKKNTGHSPAAYKKENKKGKTHAKS